jgi:hypothetical protein
MSVVYVKSRTHDVYLYKSIKSSCCKGRVVRVKYESLGQTTSYWVGQNKQAVYKICVSKGRRCGQDGRIHKVLQGVAAQVCINLY